MSTLRGMMGSAVFLRELLSGKNVSEARASTREIMGEAAPLIDPLVHALEDIQAKRQIEKEARARRQEQGPVIEAPGEDVTEPENPGKKKKR